MLQLAILLLLVLTNGFFALSELALLKARRARLERRAVKGERGAKAALALLKEPGRLLSAVQVGMTLTGVLAGALGGATLAAPLAELLGRAAWLRPYSMIIALALVVGGITYVSLVLGELFPKRLALRHPTSLACAVAPALKFLMIAAAPVVWLLNASSNTLMRMIPARSKTEPAVTEEEIKLALAQGVEEGILGPEEYAMVREVLRLSDRPVSLLMTPRSEIVFLAADEKPERVIEVISKTRHPEFPVYDGRQDNVLGLLNAKDYLLGLVSGRKPPLRESLREPLFVPSTRSALEVLELIKRRHAHLALCVDEHGGIEGLVAPRDFLGTIVGDETADSREHERQALRREDGSWLLDGTLAVDEFKEVLKLPDLPGETSGRYRTLAGFMLHLFGRIPSEGEAIEWNNYRFEIADMDSRRIDKVIVKKKDDG